MLTECASTRIANWPFVPKKHWSIKDDRAMTFKETLDSGAGEYLRGTTFQRSGIAVIENTPEEIIANALEMVDTFEGVWQSIDEDDQLQERFWSLFDKSELRDSALCRIGTKFLRENHELLC
jgi:putative glycosyltransferase (TIGR04372 family)